MPDSEEATASQTESIVSMSSMDETDFQAKTRRFLENMEDSARRDPGGARVPEVRGARRGGAGVRREGVRGDDPDGGRQVAVLTEDRAAPRGCPNRGHRGDGQNARRAGDATREFSFCELLVVQQYLL